MLEGAGDRGTIGYSNDVRRRCRSPRTPHPEPLDAFLTSTVVEILSQAPQTLPHFEGLVRPQLYWS